MLSAEGLGSMTSQRNHIHDSVASETETKVLSLERAFAKRDITFPMGSPGGWRSPDRSALQTRATGLFREAPRKAAGSLRAHVHAPSWQHNVHMGLEISQ